MTVIVSCDITHHEVTPVLSARPGTRCGGSRDRLRDHHRYRRRLRPCLLSFFPWFCIFLAIASYILDTDTMQAIKQSLNSLLTSLPPSPGDNDTLNSLVKQTLSEAQSGANPESWKKQWEFALRKSIFDLAVSSAYSHISSHSERVVFRQPRAKPSRTLTRRITTN